jgi:AcrR family transcriptional regulator
LPKVVDAEEQRSQIRRAARRVFARRGVAGTGLAHVAAAVGMGRSSLYHYYPDKASLVRDLVRDVMAGEEALFAAAVRAEGTPLARIEALTARMAELFEHWSSIGRMLLDLRLRDAQGFRPFFRKIRAHLAEVIEEGQRRGEIDRSLDPALTASIVIGAIDGLLLQHFVDAHALPRADSLADLLAAAVGKLLRP